jgi:dihydroorotate dehydrogenase electron transfer subunit
LKQVTGTIIDNRPFSFQPRQSGKRVLLGFQLMWLSCPQIEKAKPGQFVMVRCGEDFEHMLRRPLSIHQVNDDKIALWIAVWGDGKGTQWLSQRQVGDELDLLGPLGNGFTIHSGSHKLLLLAGGVGIAPLYFLAQEAVTRQCSVTLIHGASSKVNLYPEKMPPGIELNMITEKDDEQKITDLLPDFAGSADQVFACGPMPMYQTMARMPELKDKPVQISLEVRMGCGLGICYGCTVKTRNGLRQVCQHGPIFELEDIIWEELADI